MRNIRYDELDESDEEDLLEFMEQGLSAEEAVDLLVQNKESEDPGLVAFEAPVATLASEDAEEIAKDSVWSKKNMNDLIEGRMAAKVANAAAFEEKSRTEREKQPTIVRGRTSVSIHHQMEAEFRQQKLEAIKSWAAFRKLRRENGEETL